MLGSHRWLPKSSANEQVLFYTFTRFLFFPPSAPLSNIYFKLQFGALNSYKKLLVDHQFRQEHND